MRDKALQSGNLVDFYSVFPRLVEVIDGLLELRAEFRAMLMIVS
jgi:hypothetical protein